jgi:hypothetical protein
MEIYRDFRELFESFNAKKVEYVIVGSYALAHHGAPRYTRDIDLYVRPTKENSERVMAALAAYGLQPEGLTAEDFQVPKNIIQVGRPPVRVDFIMSITGVTWEQADAGKVVGEYDGEPVPFIGREELIANKKAAGRHKDLGDAARLVGEDNV